MARAFSHVPARVQLGGKRKEGEPRKHLHVLQLFSMEERLTVGKLTEWIQMRRCAHTDEDRGESWVVNGLAEG